MIPKNILSLISGIFTVILLVIGVFGTYTLCSNNEKCINILHWYFIHFLPIAPVFFFCLTVYWMRDEVYRAWFKFARLWIPLSMLAILVAPEYSTNVINPIEKGTVAIFFSGIFIVVSIVIIIWKLLPKTR